MKTYEVVGRPLKINNQLYDFGKLVQLNEVDAVQFLKLGRIKERERVSARKTVAPQRRAVRRK